MISRRSFISSCAVGLTGVALLEKKSFAGSSAVYPDHIIYTADKPGMWEKKVALHVPEVEVEGDKIIVTNAHPMTEDHYIVRHTIVSEDGVVLGGHTFSNKDKKAVSEFSIPEDMRGKKMYATSFCNLHDFWVAEFKL
ncbi:desulfoferrodoxin family protein [Maridesulfovibrio bastinii]|uniref:desulfoferrodoxin family protein n=1 Tax=Maridesulfovibrio bastinii TaxID=47157 RepID=UPI0003F7241F|nr:desulfoferrodoxin family protein [Maridesulfovibrio bastinii]